MKAADPIDTARLSLALTDLRLPAIKLVWPGLCRTIRQGGLAGRTLSGRARRARDGRTGPSPDRASSRRSPPATRQDVRQFRVRCGAHDQQSAGHGTRRWRQLAGERRQPAHVRPAGRRQIASWGGARPGAGGDGWRVLFTRTTDLVQRLQTARRDLQLEAAIAKLDKYHLLILDDLAYAQQGPGGDQRSCSS